MHDLQSIFGKGYQLLYNQPLTTRFGIELFRQIDPEIDPVWDSLDIAVAWVRSSGISYLSNSLAHFLQSGGHLSLIVGIDLRNTTQEGLQALLNLEQHGHCETYVYHNESGGIFHPKLYLFRNDQKARLIVGSNNLTESGLFINVEAGLQVDAGVKDTVILQALDAIASWKDTENRLAIRLDEEFLNRLCEEGYVPSEADVKAGYNRERTRNGEPREARLFGSKSYSRPEKTNPTQPANEEIDGEQPQQQTNANLETVLLMRLRKASKTARQTQTQIPKKAVDTAFFEGIGEIQSLHSGQTHQLIFAHARGTVNTIKMEIPEMRDFQDPFARFERKPGKMTYEVYDVGSPEGNQIRGSLMVGMHNNTTKLSISNVTKATWWRFI